MTAESLETLNLPPISPAFKTLGQKKYILDKMRRKFVIFTREEWVRQHWVWYLVDYQGVAPSLLVVEHAFKFHEMPKRADIVVFNRAFKPGLIVECKAPDVPITEKVIQQAAIYNQVLNAPYLVVSNGIDHLLFGYDLEQKKMQPLSELPDFSSW